MPKAKVRDEEAIAEIFPIGEQGSLATAGEQTCGSGLARWYKRAGDTGKEMFETAVAAKRKKKSKYLVGW